jgi:hypothetical protein
MWDERYDLTCGRHPDLVAVYGSRRGRWALLLRQTIAPLAEERTTWMAETRRAAHAVITDLRAAGLTGRFVVLQWRPIGEIVHVMESWTHCWDGDRERREEVTRVAVGQLADRQYLAAARTAVSPAVVHERMTTMLVGVGETGAICGETLVTWYQDMAPCWLAVEPSIRRELMLRAHYWIAQHAPWHPSSGPSTVRAAHELASRLGTALLPTLPPAELERWQPWVRLVVTDLQRALCWPVARRDEAWARWLFLIPYSIPVGLRTFAGVDERRAEPLSA